MGCPTFPTMPSLLPQRNKLRFMESSFITIWIVLPFSPHPDSLILKKKKKILSLIRIWTNHLGFRFLRASLVVQLVKNPPAMQETWVQSLGWEDPLEKGSATHSSILAWRIPWTTWSMGSQRVRHD